MEIEQIDVLVVLIKCLTGGRTKYVEICDVAQTNIKEMKHNIRNTKEIKFIFQKLYILFKVLLKNIYLEVKETY